MAAPEHLQALPVNDELASERRRRWAVDLGGGRLRLIESLAALRQLIAQRRVTSATRIYELGAGPTVLSDVPELDRLLPRTPGAAADVDDEPPPIRPPPRARRTTLDRFNDELAVLDRPLDSEVEYYDARPRSGWRRAGARLAVLAVLAGLAGGAFLLAQRLLAARSQHAEAPSPSTSRAAPSPPAPTRRVPVEPPTEDPPAPGEPKGESP